jgi:hypothetical protein
MDDDLFYTLEHDLHFKTGRWPTFFEDERQPNFYLNGRRLKKNAILINRTVQHRQPDQHDQPKKYGTTKNINLNWL